MEKPMSSQSELSKVLTEAPSNLQVTTAGAATNKDPKFFIFGVNIQIKYLSLLCLVVQNSALVLTMRYSRTVEGPRFYTSTAVAVSEFLKMLCSFALLFLEDGYSFAAVSNRLRREIWDIPWDTLKVSVPAILYTIQNNLQYVAVSHLDAATFQVTYQLKILTTAVFSVVMLQKVLTSYKWLSLLILTIGIALVQLPPDVIKTGFVSAIAPTLSSDPVTTELTGEQSALVGLTAVLAACILSGFAGVYFEKILKGSPVSIWVRNIQLGFYGTVIGLSMVIIQDGSKVLENGYFYGYLPITWIVIFNQAFGGLLVAVVVKYADNILKGYATSISIILSSICSVFFFGFEITYIFILGSTMVIAAVFMYS